MTGEQARTWSWAGVVGPIAFLGASVLGATQVDGYSARTNMVSELAAKGSDARLLMTTGFLVYGVCLVVLGLVIRRVWPTVLALAVMVGLSGIGAFAAGAGACDPGCPTSGPQSFSQQVHSVASVPTFLLWFAATVLAAWRFRDHWYGRLSMALAVVQVAALIGLGALSSDETDLDAPDGAVQRVSLVASGAWVIATSAALRPGAQPAARRQAG